MRLEIVHRTSYRYSEEVHLDRHVLRVLPRPDPRHRLIGHRVEIEPTPTRIFDFVDVSGNWSNALCFEGASDLLAIDVRLEVETGPADRSGAAAFPEDLSHPLDYGSETAALRPYLMQPEAPELMAGFTSDLVEQSNGRLFGLLERLNGRVHGFYRHGVRLKGAAQSPAVTLSSGEGVCRDLAVLFMAACRHLGIAARFASGYQAKPAGGSREQRYLHAWAEVYLPHAGWHGYDQTHGSLVGDQHVIVAAAVEPSATTPIEGSFRFVGAAPTSTLETDLRITRRDFDG